MFVNFSLIRSCVEWLGGLFPRSAVRAGFWGWLVIGYGGWWLLKPVFVLDAMLVLGGEVEKRVLKVALWGAT